MKRLFALALLMVSPAFADTFSLEVNGAPPSGLVIAPLDLTGYVADAEPSSDTLTLRIIGQENGSISAQFVPDLRFDPINRAAGVIVLQLPGPGNARLEMEAAATKIDANQNSASIEGGGATIEFGENGKSAFPTRIRFKNSGKAFDGFSWNDRVYENEKHEQYWLREDKQSELRVISAGDVCTVVRGTGRFIKPDGQAPDSAPEAVYDWFIFKNKPALYVSCEIDQKKDFFWSEMHFLELSYPDASMPQYVGAAPAGKGQFTGSNKSSWFSDWAAISDGADVVAAFSGKSIVYDGIGGFGNYLNAGWESFRGRQWRTNAWLWIGETNDPETIIPSAMESFSLNAKAALSHPGLEKKLDSLQAVVEKASPSERVTAKWERALARRLASQGGLNEAMAIADGHEAEHVARLQSGGFILALRVDEKSARLLTLFDAKTGTEFSSSDAPPLFNIELRAAVGDELVDVDSETGWGKVSLSTESGLMLTFEKPADERLGDLVARVYCQPRAEQGGFAWRMTADCSSADWRIENVRFPQIAVTRFGEQVSAFTPVGPGQMHPQAGEKPYSYSGRYSSGWCSMPIMGVFDQSAGLGLYCAVHDEWGSTRNLRLDNRPGSQSVLISFAEPVADMDKTPSHYESPGDSVWQLVRGDWFDAAMIYKQWADEHARWIPSVGADGREDTPLWMRELCAWAMTGGAPGDCVQAVKDFQQYLGAPCGFHWYNWHQNPFDNDYPHYFPTKDGVTEAVADLQQHNVYVMPYINGRLWDTRDKGAEDAEFTSVALPSATKKRGGEPFVESYGSKETDGSPVKLGVMCPTTELWRKTMKDTVLRIQNEVGTRGVYIDQIAAADPALCMDSSHGHPLGGGHWWTEGYWKLLEELRKEMQPDRMITTECNAEPYIRWLDGYLTWHWQYDGMVPFFSAIYGGKIQMFGRSYGAGTTKDLSMRMKAAQQLAFGEQIGWIDPNLLLGSESKDFFRQCVRMRLSLNRYFYAGEMARPPKLTDDVPKIKGDWQWNGEMWVTTDAVIAGAWRIPAESKTVLLFANISDEPVSSNIDLSMYCLAAAKPEIIQRNPERETGKLDFPDLRHAELTVPARTVIAWEIR
jgi:hypothetical protein